MEVGDHLRALRRRVQDSRQALRQLLLRKFTLSVPRRRRDIATAGEQDRADLAELALRTFDARRGFEDWVDGERVVVAGRDDAAHVRVEPLISQLAPAL